MEVNIYKTINKVCVNHIQYNSIISSVVYLCIISKYLHCEQIEIGKSFIKIVNVLDKNHYPVVYPMVLTPLRTYSITITLCLIRNL